MYIRIPCRIAVTLTPSIDASHITRHWWISHDREGPQEICAGACRRETYQTRRLWPCHCCSRHQSSKKSERAVCILGFGWVQWLSGTRLDSIKFWRVKIIPSFTNFTCHEARRVWYMAKQLTADNVTSSILSRRIPKPYLSSLSYYLLDRLL